MDVEIIPDTGKCRGYNVRLSINAKTDVTNKRLIKDRVYGFSFKMPALWQSSKAGLFGLVDCCAHFYS